MAEVRCGHCGTPVGTSGHKFCEECGKPIDAGQQGPSSQDQQAKNREQAAKKGHEEQQRRDQNKAKQEREQAAQATRKRERIERERLQRERLAKARQDQERKNQERKDREDKKTQERRDREHRQATQQAAEARKLQDEVAEDPDVRRLREQLETAEREATKRAEEKRKQKEEERKRKEEERHRKEAAEKAAAERAAAEKRVEELRKQQELDLREAEQRAKKLQEEQQAAEDEVDPDEQAEHPGRRSGPLEADQDAKRQRHCAGEEHPADAGMAAKLYRGDALEDAFGDEGRGEEQRQRHFPRHRVEQQQAASEYEDGAECHVEQEALPAVGPKGVEARVDQAMEALFSGSGAMRPRFALDYVELDVGRANEVLGLAVTPFAAKHTPQTNPTALRVAVGDKIVTYSGDGEFTPDLCAASRDADLFIAECYFHDTPVKGHMNHADIREHGADLGAKRMVLTHLGPRMLAVRHEVAEECAEDGLVINL